MTHITALFFFFFYFPELEAAALRYETVAHVATARARKTSAPVRRVVPCCG